jgi:hypothetical protein
MYIFIYISTTTLQKFTSSMNYQQAIMKRDGWSHRKSEKQARLPNNRITNKQKLEKVVAEIAKKENRIK